MQLLALAEAWRWTQIGFCLGLGGALAVAIVFVMIPFLFTVVTGGRR